MNYGRYFIPYSNYPINLMGYGNVLNNRFGLFGRIGNSIRHFNWNGLLNGANKTLNVVNQTIPLVRQAGPMFNNMKSMLRLARAFGNETTNNLKKKKFINNESTNKDYSNNDATIDSKVSSTLPNFFI